MSYQEAIQYLESLVNYEKLPSYPYKEALDLKRFQRFLDAINNPQRSLRCIHLAGSKGKGSTAAFLTYILREAGFQVGLYTSPHLIDFRERIRILQWSSPRKRGSNYRVDSRLRGNDIGHGKSSLDFEGMISKPKLASLVEKLKPAIEKYNRASGCEQLTFFEACTALAFLYFQEKKVDFAVLETGLGGRLDATNMVNPLVSVITAISYEHMDKLGRTLAKIAAEKAGIIKRYAFNRAPSAERRAPIVVSAPQKKEVLEVIKNKCRKEGAELLVVGKDIEYSGSEEDFSVTTPYGNYQNLKIKLIGAHQIMNAAVAVAAVGALSVQGTCHPRGTSHSHPRLKHSGAGSSGHPRVSGDLIPACAGMTNPSFVDRLRVSIDSIRNGLYNTVWPGRCEVVVKKPMIVLDGAQNRASVGVLKKTIKGKFRYRRLILVFGVSNDKDIAGIAQELEDLTDKVILTKSTNPRATEPEALRKFFKGKETYITNSVKEARNLALRLAGKEDLILVTGSLYVVGEARKGHWNPCTPRRCTSL